MADPLPSMRPRFANRGSGRDAGQECRPRPAFNEAPIRESGKSASANGKRFSMAAFNEAPIRESGKSINQRPAQSRDATLQ